MVSSNLLRYLISKEYWFWLISLRKKVYVSDTTTTISSFTHPMKGPLCIGGLIRMPLLSPFHALVAWTSGNFHVFRSHKTRAVGMREGMGALLPVLHAHTHSLSLSRSFTRSLAHQQRNGAESGARLGNPRALSLA